jgi:hypothetical protein
MDILFCILKTVICYFLFIFLGTNLIGVIARGLIPCYWKDESGNKFMREDISSAKSILTSLIFFLLGLIYLYLLYHYFNIWLAISATVLAITRLPDILFELKTGEKVNVKNMPKRTIDIFFVTISWLVLPLIWYALCYLQT